SSSTWRTTSGLLSSTAVSSADTTTGANKNPPTRQSSSTITSGPTRLLRRHIHASLNESPTRLQPQEQLPGHVAGRIPGEPQEVTRGHAIAESFLMPTTPGASGA